MKSYRVYEQGQGELFPPRVGDLVPEKHQVRVFSEIIDRFDLRAFDANYKTSGVNSGAPAWHPAMMIKLLFWGYSHGIRSSRQLAEFAQFDVRAMWLCGSQRPRHAAIARFRQRHMDCLPDLFLQILDIARDLGISACGDWASDGTRVLANAGRKAIATRDRLEAERDQLRGEIVAALQAAEAADHNEPTGDESDDADGEDGDDNGYHLPPDLRRKQDRLERIEAAIRRLDETKSQTANATDPEAPTMARTDVGTSAPAYNAQLTVDVDSGLIVACDVTDRHTDSGQLLAQLDQAMAATGNRPRALLADAGYASGPGFAGLEARGVTGYVSQRPPSSGPYFPRARFEYDAGRDAFICPAGRQLVRDRKERHYTEAGSYARTVYRCEDCSACPLAAACKKPGVKRRTLRVSEHEDLQRSMRARMATEEGAMAYRRRKSSVEPAFGTLKEARGFRRFLVRGLAAVTAEWRLACCAFNLSRLTRLLQAGAATLT